MVKITGRAYNRGFIFRENFFFKKALYKKTIITASKPKANAPVKPITDINSFRPRKNKIKGAKQAISQDNFGESPKSYQNIFFKVNPRTIKEVKVVITPKINPRRIIPSPRVSASPEMASFEVFWPEAPKTKKIKNM